MKLQLIKKYFDEQSKSWDEFAYHDAQKLQFIVKACDLKPEQKIIDVACGTGVLFPYLLAKNPNLLLGVDISDSMVKIARSKFSDSRLHVIAEDFINLKTEGFDRVILYNAYPHFFDKFVLARKMYEVLKQDGRFVVAHSHSREQLNAIHCRRGVDMYSLQLKSTKIECRWFEPWFSIDRCLETDEIYILSGVKRDFKSK